MKVKQYFDILGIAPTKNLKAIKKAYRKKALLYHPDRNSSPEAKEKFIQVTEAYDQLTIAIEQAVKRGSTIESAHTQYKRNQRPAPPHKSRAQKEREERYKQARQRYKQMQRKEAEAFARYYQSLISGKKWLFFKGIVIACALTSLLLILDNVFLPTALKEEFLAMSNRQIIYANISGEKTTPIILENGKKAWVPDYVMAKGKTQGLTIEYTALFNDIKSINLWNKEKWEVYTPDYSVIKTFPFVPLFLFLPLVTLWFKSKSYTFIVFYNFSIYFMSVFLFIILYSNNRLIHLITPY